MFSNILTDSLFFPDHRLGEDHSFNYHCVRVWGLHIASKEVGAFDAALILRTLTGRSDGYHFFLSDC